MWRLYINCLSLESETCWQIVLFLDSRTLCVDDGRLIYFSRFSLFFSLILKKKKLYSIGLTENPSCSRRATKLEQQMHWRERERQRGKRNEVGVERKKKKKAIESCTMRCMPMSCYIAQANVCVVGISSRGQFCLLLFQVFFTLFIYVSRDSSSL